MALSPKDVLPKNDVQTQLLNSIEARIDVKLRDTPVEEGKAFSFSFEDVASAKTINSATVKALQRLYSEAGWHDVQVNTTHSILTMACPRYRRRGLDEDEAHAGGRGCAG